MRDSSESPREKDHRLSPGTYRGRRAVSFTACLERRRPCLNDPDLVTAMVGHLAEAADRHRCVVPVYTFMPDHLHVLLLGTEDTSDLKAAMNWFKARSGWWLYRNHPDIHWQKDYWDHVVRILEGWENQARYIALNPVRAGLAEHVFDWPYTGSIGCDLKETLIDAFW
ncbi:MAG: REP-associated tyrosine transposase [Fimbriimonas sp.]